MFVKETFIKTLIDKRSYRIDLVNIQSWGSPHKMYKLMVKVRKKLVFIIRREAWDFYLKDLIAKAKTHRVKKGFFYDYGKGDPLKEFEDNDLEDFTFLSKKGKDGTYVFCGNHKKYSGAFRYHIWSRKLASQIRQKLNN